MLNHSLLSTNIVFVLILKSLELRLVTIMPVSSACRMSLAFLVVIFGRRFIYERKNKGPRTESCGTPCLTFSHLKEVLL
jgi:hypothetical protein